MNKENRNNEDKLQKTATTAIAAASSSPFTTAFKITIGIALAQTATTIMGLAVIVGLVLLVKLLF